VRIAGGDDVATLTKLRLAWNVENGSGEDDTFPSRFTAW
jgi:hypothetical protein